MSNKRALKLNKLAFFLMEKKIIEIHFITLTLSDYLKYHSI
jgi:hypothetical protein